MIAKFYGDELDVNVEFTLRAVNSHDDLVKALEELVEATALERNADCNTMETDYYHYYAAARDALKKAKGK